MTTPVIDIKGFYRRHETIACTFYDVNSTTEIPSGVVAAVGGYFESMFQTYDCFRQFLAARNSNRLTDQKYRESLTWSQLDFLGNLEALNKHIIKSMKFKGMLGLSAIACTIGTIASVALRKNKIALIPGIGILATMVVAGKAQTWNGTRNNYYLKQMDAELHSAVSSNNILINTLYPRQQTSE